MTSYREQAAERRQLLLRIFRYFRPDGLRIVLLLGLIGISSLVGLLHVWPLAILVDVILSPDGESHWIHHVFPWIKAIDPALQIAALAGAIVTLHLVGAGLNTARSLVHTSIGNNVVLRVRSDLFQRFQELHLAYHKSQPLGDRMFRVTNDAIGFPNILNVLIGVAVAVATLVVMLGIMLWRSVELTAVALIVAPLLFLSNLAFSGVLKSQSERARDYGSQFTATTQRGLSCIPLTQLFGREADEFCRFQQAASVTIQCWFDYHRQMAWYRLCVSVISGTGAAAVFAYGGYLVYRDQFFTPESAGMTVGDLVVFVTYLGMLYGPLCQLTGAPNQVRHGITGSKRVLEVLDHEPLVRDAPHAVRLPLRPRTLALEKVGFAYMSGKPVLRNVDMEVPPGQLVAVVGPSGVGKTTLLSLLVRFFDPTEGAVRLDGHDLRDVKLRDLRRHIALVSQETPMLPTTIAENIAYGRRDATIDEIRSAAEAAGAASFIEDLPDAYDHPIGEDGGNLSGGQRQRIAIARALITKAPILILDEPTSALDARHEQALVRTLRSLRGRRTILVVSHRLSTVANCDRIFVLHDGRIAEHGHHDDLMAARRHYYEMAQQQFPQGDRRISEQPSGAGQRALSGR